MIKATMGSAGTDLMSMQDCTIHPGETEMIRTGIAIHIKDPNYAGLIMARSGISSKRGLAPANKVGLIDSDYQGELIVALHNHSDTYQVIHKGEKIAQLVFIPVAHPFMVCVKEFEEETDRGSGGFGSTG